MTQRGRVMEGVLCQSCGATLYRPSDFGTDADGLRVAEYCRACFTLGRFNEPNLTLDQLIKRSIPGADGKAGVGRAHVASHPLAKTLPKLDRWRHAEEPEITDGETTRVERIRRSVR